ncbi:carboxymuconolactone decarboxylase family protein [Catenulispora sp. NL8]|uniref:Carboxymuconolactone decarboxylase family protein n=1 Tax=Catenulispora pinistramenti TaxID=2705254 RepID=A0ABS5KSN4_9ACTN|nr:carboxymuconolactone decarboxylase family protein [Catenulispora pinistramenti]
MRGWGGYELSRRLSLTPRDREIVTDRTCARCGCEYEWGVHVEYFADRAGLTREQISSTAWGSSADPCWPVLARGARPAAARRGRRAARRERHRRRAVEPPRRRVR